MSLGFSALRIGQGYDVHKLVEGRKLIIGGKNIAAVGISIKDRPILFACIVISHVYVIDIRNLFIQFKTVTEVNLCRCFNRFYVRRFGNIEINRSRFAGFQTD